MQDAKTLNSGEGKRLSAFLFSLLSETFLVNALLSILYLIDKFDTGSNTDAMDDTERRSAKRSRFDQTEPEPKARSSRFDRRSRSPPARKSDASRRSRSPIGDHAKSSDSPTRDAPKKVNPDAAAAAGRSPNSFRTMS